MTTSKLPSIEVMEGYLRLVALVVEECAEAMPVFERLEEIIEEARAAQCSDPVTRLRARQAAQKRRTQ